MKTLFKAAALSATILTASIALPTIASAQAVAPATIVLIDLEEVIGTSAAGKAAQVTLQGQATSLQARVKTLTDGFQKEEESLAQAQQTNSMAQAAFEAKVKDLMQRKQNAQTEIQGRQRTLAASERYVVEQINRAVQPIITAVMKEKGAQIALARGATVQAASSLDITAEVVRRLDATLKTVSTTPPAQPAAAPKK